MLLRILLTVLLFSSFNMFFPSISYADSKLDIKHMIYVFIAMIGNSCVESGEEYYVNVNSHMTKDDFIRDYEQIDDVLQSCTRRARNIFYRYNDEKVNDYVTRVFKDKSFRLQVHGVASCSFFGGYSFLQKNSGKKMSYHDQKKVVLTCMDLKLK